MQMLFISSIPPAKKERQKTKSAKKILKGITYTSRVCLYTMLVYPVKLCIVPNTSHGTMLKNYQPNQTYSTYHSPRMQSERDRMYQGRLTEKRAYTREERSIPLSVNDNYSTNVDDPIYESRRKNYIDRVDDSIFEDFIRKNRERFMQEKEEITGSASMRRQGSSRHYVMDDWIFEDFIRKNRERIQLEKEEIISIDDYSDDELEDSLAYGH